MTFQTAKLSTTGAPLIIEQVEENSTSHRFVMVHGGGVRALLVLPRDGGKYEDTPRTKACNRSRRCG